MKIPLTFWYDQGRITLYTSLSAGFLLPGTAYDNPAAISEKSGGGTERG